MKNLFFLLLPAFLMSCGGGVEQYRASIETLSTEWDSTTAAVTELSSNINNDLSEISKAASELRLSEEVTAKLTPEQATTWQTAQQTFTQSIQGFAPLRTEIGEFTKTWSEEAAKLQALKDGLASGQLPEDVTAQIDNFKTLIGQAKESIGKWQTAYETAKTNAQNGLEALKAAHSSITAAAPAK